MTYIIVTLLAAATAALGLSLHRFAATPEARKTPLYADTAREYVRWLGRRTPAAVRSLRPRGQAAAAHWLPALRRLDPLAWLYLAFWASFLFLAASGFIFAVFVPRGLHGYPLLGHVAAGGIFAVSLAAGALVRGRRFTAAAANPGAGPAAHPFEPRHGTSGAAVVRNAAFWLFVLGGVLLVLSAALPMFPFVRTAGQRLFLEIHRYAALLSVLAAAAAVDLDLYVRRDPRDPEAEASSRPV